MIISAPFLPPHAATDDYGNYLKAAMACGNFGDGAFPLGADLAWHGGVHLTAPARGAGVEPVRAIADGTVVYVRAPKNSADADADDPLNYVGWTDNGCVVIKHETEIGEDVGVTFYSIMLHLQQIEPSVQKGSKIWRKNKVGQAGRIYGKSHQLHVEIICDDDNLARLTGRSDGTLDIGSHGRTDALFGKTYIHLPSGTSFYSQPPTASGPAAAPTWTSDVPLVIGISLSRVGQTQFVTLTSTGESIGTAPARTDTELYEQACTMAQTQAAVARDTYELMRFGRVLEALGSDTDTLAHWQQVAYPGGHGWVNLHGADARAFSEADFPDWCGWRLINDDTNTDSRCDSEALLDLMLQDNNNGSPNQRRTDALAVVADPKAQKRLAMSICKFPTEWQASTTEARWSWLKTDSPPGASRTAGPYLDPEDYPEFVAHSKALCFWDEANLGIPAAHWHFHPREFIRVFRECGWLSRDEMIQLFPRTAMRKAGNRWVSERVGVRMSTVENYHKDLNKACRRYGIVTPLRMAAFYANAMQETMWFGKLHENNSNVRYWPWDGRGFLQLTWPDNYIKYWRFIGRTINDRLARDLHDAARQADHQRSNAPLVALETRVATADMKNWRTELSDGTRMDLSADCACAYWAWSRASQYADAEPANTRASKPAPAHNVYYTSPGMGNVAATVNRGKPSTNYSSINGIVARFQAYNTCEVTLLDTPIFPGTNQPHEPRDYRPRHP